jgi:hypothetical protein
VFKHRNKIGDKMKLAEEETHLRSLQELVARAYAAMSNAGSNDAEHDVLYELVEYAEDDIRRQGGDLPPDPSYDDA